MPKFFRYYNIENQIQFGQKEPLDVHFSNTNCWVIIMGLSFGNIASLASVS
jgi:hypothetical protein